MVTGVSILITLLLTLPFARAADQSPFTTPCSPSLILLDPVLKGKIRFWGKVINVKDSEELPAGRELIFSPKTVFSGPKLKEVKVFLKKGPCWLDVKVDDFLSVSLSEKGEGTAYGIVASNKSASKSSNKYPAFQPWFNPCTGFKTSMGFKSADLFAIATVEKIEVDQRENVRVFTFKTKKIWNGPDKEKFRVIDEIKGTCPKSFTLGKSYELILNAADENYYYQDCCGFMNGPVDDDYESRFSKDREAQKKKYLKK